MNQIQLTLYIDFSKCLNEKIDILENDENIVIE